MCLDYFRYNILHSSMSISMCHAVEKWSSLLFYLQQQTAIVPTQSGAASARRPPLLMYVNAMFNLTGPV